MWATAGTPDPIGLIAHLIQTALPPVFLLSGIASLLNVFNTRLARVSDHVAHLAELLHKEEVPAERRRLHAHLARLAGAGSCSTRLLRLAPSEAARLVPPHWPFFLAACGMPPSPTG